MFDTRWSHASRSHEADLDERHAFAFFAVAIMAPAIVLTMIFQKYVVKGLTMGAVKG